MAVVHLLSIFSLGDGNSYNAIQAEELQTQRRKKKKRKMTSAVILYSNK